MDAIYYESHITIEPILTRMGLATFEEICGRHQFRPAKLLMQKDRLNTLERSNKDAFCTGRGNNLRDLKTRMLLLSSDLVAAGFEVWRRKIEAVIFDEKLSYS